MKFFRGFLLLICIGVFLYGAINLIQIFLTYRDISRRSSEIQDRYTSLLRVGEIEGDQLLALLESGIISEVLAIDWENLLNRNSDVIAWIHLPYTNISHPVLQGETNDTYLRTTIDRVHCVAGSIFMDSSNNPLFTDLNTMIHGHNMRNNTMFAQITTFSRGHFESIPSHVQIYLPDGRLKLYKVVSISSTNTSNPIYAGTARTLEDFFEIMAIGRVYNVDFDRERVEHILSLSTCSGFAANTRYRALLYAVLDIEVNL